MGGFGGSPKAIVSGSETTEKAPLIIRRRTKRTTVFPFINIHLLLKEQYNRKAKRFIIYCIISRDIWLKLQLKVIRVTMKIFSKNGFFDLIESIEKEGKISRRDLDEMVHSCVEEVLVMLFGKQIAPVLENSLEIDDLNNDFDSARVMEKLDMLFGNDAKSIRAMIAGMTLTKYHQQEFMKNLGLLAAP